MNKSNENPSTVASIPKSSMFVWVAFMLFAPASFVSVGILGQLDCFDLTAYEFPFWVFIAVGASALMILAPFALSLRHVTLDRQHIVASSLISTSRTISIGQVYSVDVSSSSSLTVTIKLLGGSKIRYIPRRIGIFDVAEPTERLMEYAAANRRNAE